MNKYTVLITTSGTGSRLGDITKYTNKSLIKVGKKPAISYIIESYPKNTKFVVTTGYYGNQVKDFLKLVYPKRDITIVEVDKFEGPGTSLGYSMLQAKKFLQCPFIYHACDTIVLDQKIPSPSYNWNGGYQGEGSSHYASFDVVGGKIKEIYDKGFLDPDFLHIGLVGIHDYNKFWYYLEKKYSENPNDSTLNDVSSLNQMFKNGFDFRVINYKTWYDIGNAESLQKARHEINDSFYILDKLGESIFIYKKSVVKFFFDEEIVKNRVSRAKILNKLVPKIEDVTPNFYKYKYEEGQLYSSVVNPHDFKNFLEWAKINLWKKAYETNNENFKKVCYDFYYNKTIKRIDNLLTSRFLSDQQNIINGENIPSIKELLKLVDFKELSESKQTLFHGDFILDNIIKTKKGYKLLDWRQDFGGLLKSGDMYYDLAKLKLMEKTSYVIF